MPSKLFVCVAKEPRPVPKSRPYEEHVVDSFMEGLREAGEKNVHVSEVTPVPFVYFVTVSWD